jgi:hypothetical protein
MVVIFSEGESRYGLNRSLNSLNSWSRNATYSPRKKL